MESITPTAPPQVTPVYVGLYPILQTLRSGSLAEHFRELMECLAAEEEFAGPEDMREFAALIMGSTAYIEAEELYACVEEERIDRGLEAWLSEEDWEQLLLNIFQLPDKDKFRSLGHLQQYAAERQAVQRAEGWIYEQMGPPSRLLPRLVLRPPPPSPPPPPPPLWQQPPAELPPGAPPALCAANLVRYHIATQAQPLPTERAPIVWLFAGNGTFKCGQTAEMEAQIQVEPTATLVPGLAQLLPRITWSAWPQRLPGALLEPLLTSARQAIGAEGLPIEKQFFLVWRDGTVRLVSPQGQQGTATRLRYTMPGRGTVLCDIHSHHDLPAYFSPIDNYDDTGIGLSMVIGRINDQPELLCRINIYGHRQIVPAELVFDGVTCRII